MKKLQFSLNKLIRPGLHNLVKVAIQLSELQISHSDPVMFLDSSSDWWIIIAVGNDDYFIVIYYNQIWGNKTGNINILKLNHCGKD